MRFSVARRFSAPYNPPTVISVHIATCSCSASSRSWCPCMGPRCSSDPRMKIRIDDTQLLLHKYSCKTSVARMVSALLYQAFYRIGFTPWDGHALSSALRELIEGPTALPVGTAIDIGCGTGDAAIYLARHGWQVTGVDFVPRALAKARTKAQAHQTSVNFVEADVTH